MPFFREQKKGISSQLNERNASQVRCELLFFFEIVFARAADRTFPVPGYIFPLGAGRHAIVRVTGFGIVNIAAECANITVHFYLRKVRRLVLTMPSKDDAFM